MAGHTNDPPISWPDHLPRLELIVCVHGQACPALERQLERRVGVGLSCDESVGIDAQDWPQKTTIFGIKLIR